MKMTTVGSYIGPYVEKFRAEPNNFKKSFWGFAIIFSVIYTCRSTYLITELGLREFFAQEYPYIFNLIKTEDQKEVSAPIDFKKEIGDFKKSMIQNNENRK